MARGKPDITFQWERLPAIARELPPLFQRHWEEIALNKERVPLDPDWNRYFDYDLVGILRILTARTESGTLAGYYFVLVFPHLHYASTLWAQTDMFWIDPLYRQGWTGIRMFREMEKGLRQLGVKVVFVNIKVHFNAERGTLKKLLERLGYKFVEMAFSKYLG